MKNLKKNIHLSQIENVFKNLDIIKNELSFGDICKGKQDHTDRVIIIDEDNKDNYLFKTFLYKCS